MNWVKKGQATFGWTDEFIFNSFFTYSNKLINKKEDFFISGDDGNGTGEGLDCSCRSHWACFAYGRGCSDNDCTKTSGGCGFFGDMDCTGLCG